MFDNPFNQPAEKLSDDVLYWLRFIIGCNQNTDRHYSMSESILAGIALCRPDLIDSIYSDDMRQMLNRLDCSQIEALSLWFSHKDDWLELVREECLGLQ